jgi:hypothetical protein
MTTLFGGAVHDSLIDLGGGNTFPAGIAGTSGWQSYPTTSSTSTFANKLVRVSIDNNGSGDLTGGDGNAHARIYLSYTLEDLT